MADFPRVLFTAKHRVNFAMFNPVYQLLRRRRDLKLFLSSGRYRNRYLFWLPPKDPEFRNEHIFGEFDIDPEHFLPTSSHDRRAYDLYVSSNQSSRMQPKNCGLTVQIFHGVSFRNFAVNPGYLRFDKLFFPGRYMMEQYLGRGLLEEGDPRIELMGMPKLDRLVDGSLERDEMLRRLGLDPSRPTVLWCPTGARRNGFERFGARGIRAIEKADVNLILKLHDHPHLARGVSRDDILAMTRETMGEHSRLVDYSDVAPLLVAADLLVTDASSVAYEYCLLDRPIVFIDVPRLLQSRARMENSAMDLETHGRKIGRIVQTPDELFEAVGQELAQPERLSDLRRAAAGHIFYKPGSASRRMADRLVELARQ